MPTKGGCLVESEDMGRDIAHSSCKPSKDPGPSWARRRVARGCAVTWTAAISTLTLTCLLLIGASSAKAQTPADWYTFGTSGNWTTASNWDCSGTNAYPQQVPCVPKNGGGLFFDVVSGTNPGVAITFNAFPTTIDTMTVAAGQTLQDQGNGISSYLTIGDPTSPYTNSGTLFNIGTVNWGNGSILTVGTPATSNANIINLGSLNISDATLQVNGNFLGNNSYWPTCSGNCGVLNVGNA